MQYICINNAHHASDSSASGGLLYCMSYPKPPLSLEQQVALLRSRGLLVKDEQFAITILEKISFQRLKAYFSTYYTVPTISKQFNKGTTFETIIQLYSFDEELRQVVFNLISKIEVAFRTQLVNTYSTSFGTHWHQDSNLFEVKIGNPITQETTFDLLATEIKSDCNNQTDDIFIKQYYFEYNSPPYPDLPPSWMTLEVLSFGKLSRIYKLLNGTIEKQKIAAFFGTLPVFLVSWLESLSYVRNICAHHGLLWRRVLTKQPSLPTRSSKRLVSNAELVNNKKLYAALLCLQQMSISSRVYLDFSTELQTLFAKYHFIDFSQIGFPENWNEEQIWKN